MTKQNSQICLSLLILSKYQLWNFFAYPQIWTHSSQIYIYRKVHTLQAYSSMKPHKSQHTYGNRTQINKQTISPLNMFWIYACSNFCLLLLSNTFVTYCFMGSAYFKISFYFQFLALSRWPCLYIISGFLLGTVIHEHPS